MAEAIIITKGSKRKVHKALLKAGVTEKNIPEQYQDKTIARSAPSPGLGSIVVNNLSGLQPSKAVRAVRTFENNLVKGREDLVEKLEAVEGELSEKQAKLLTLLRDPKNAKKSLAYLVAMVGDTPIGVMKAYAKGCKTVADAEALIIASQNSTPLIKDIFRHAIDEEIVCVTCVGTGKVPEAANKMVQTMVCPVCTGSGKNVRTSEHKEWAAKVALEIQGRTQKGGPLVQVNTQVNNNVGENFMASILKTNEQILYPKKVVEAEVVGEEEPTA